ncbi:MAG: YigZ family protein [Chlorobi bacterium]|nr:YigZ family protein [Chlorobiota bacterium]
MSEKFITVKKFTETRLKEKGSTFIGQAFPVESVDDAEAILEQIRKKYYDAAHHCYAYLLKDNSFKYSDDAASRTEPLESVFTTLFNISNLSIHY